MRRYQEIVKRVHQRINAGTLKPGDQLPSVREMGKQSGYSPVTIHHAYGLLESEGIIQARARSGFYVTATASRMADFPDADLHDADASPVSVSRLVYRLMSSWQDDTLENFASISPSADLLSNDQLRRQLLQVLRQGFRQPVVTEPEGDGLLREIIAKRAAQRGIMVRARDVLITSSAISALNLCLDVITKPGDTILVESPSFFPLFAALQRRQLKAVEIYSHPKNGLDPDQFAYLLDKNDIKACLLMPANHYPTGTHCSEDAMRRIAANAAMHGVPIIENDLYGELTFGSTPAPTLKMFDEDDIVLQIGSFADTLGSGFGLGWVLTGRHHATLVEQNFFASLTGGDPGVQRAIAQYMTRHSYDRHLRHVRETMAARMWHGLALAAQCLPRHCAVTQPAGGFMCWIRGPTDLDATLLSRKALSLGVTLPPGPMFSVANSFKNFFALNMSFPWNSAREEKLRRIAEVLKQRC